MKKISLYGRNFYASDNEFDKEYYEKYCNLNIYRDLGDLEKLSLFLADISEQYNNNTILFWSGGSHGNFVPLDCANHFKKVYIYNLSPELLDITNKNKDNNNVSIVVKEDIETIVRQCFEEDQKTKIIFYTDTNTHIPYADYLIFKPPFFLNSPQFKKIDYEGFNVYVNNDEYDTFYKNFSYYFIGEKFNYDNLINLCIMVKNGGILFQKMITENLSLIDRWTILDTGSTDGTIEFIENFLVPKKKGKLYKEDFIDFGKSRNRCLDLAGKTCKYNLMLDDTYIVKGDLRSFLKKVRGDQFSNSFSLYVQSADNEYVSNRITKSRDNLRYIFKIHEVIQVENNKNVIIPIDDSLIFDERADYMEERTMTRKQLDLKLLFEEVKEDPENPRHLYYIAQTYSLLKDYEKAAEYFEKRVDHKNDGFIAEKHDAYFELARLYNFRLNKPWDLCEKTYMKAYELDKNRPESFYFIGIHYYLQRQRKVAYDYFVKAYNLGYPLSSQYSLKPTLSYHFLLKFLVELCYEQKNYKLGLECAKLFLQKNNPNGDFYDSMKMYYAIYNQLIDFENRPVTIMNKRDKKIIVFVADGGFNSWSGSSINNIGVGGSETFIIEMSRWLAKYTELDVRVFCKCVKSEIYENVSYHPLTEYYSFIKQNYVHTVMVSRYIEYLPATYLGFVDNVFLIMHDLALPGSVLISNQKLRKIFCLSPWHSKYLAEVFPMYKDIISSFGYGIDKKFLSSLKNNTKKFIYSSFPNRGLRVLLTMWPKIKAKYPDAILDLYVDLNNDWVNVNYPQEMEKIKEEVKQDGINMKGWVDKNSLSNAWKEADVWLYPCIYHETFCLTALEAAASETLIITNDLAALADTVGDRGVIIKGDPQTESWQNSALEKVFDYFENREKYDEYLIKGKEYARKTSWENRAKDFYLNYINPLEYKCMFNWTNDLPKGSKVIFEKILLTHSRDIKKILEIGTYAGTSLVHMMDLLPQSIAYAVDKWSGYDEKDYKGETNKGLSNMELLDVQKSFVNNIKTRNYTDRIRFFKDDSVNALSKFLAEKERFDLIYIDGSHKLLDCYADLILSWNLLNKNGILIIDDYLFVSDSILDTPKLSVDHFLEKYKNKYEILSKEYRVFLKKL